ncbi:MAG: DUF364 domain-containing protein [Bacteroidales bacterium]|jgi:uncharacterized protein (DUF4213/DUF364 family)|nr:DUF364 domain-containing protein [Bacteroidales bacterium]
MQEPLEYLFEKYGIEIQNIKNIICGEKYVAVMLKNGNIGVCATLDNYVNINSYDIKYPDLKNLQHRIVLNAYFNAAFNYNNKYDTTIDIFDKIDFKKYNKIVMIGFFQSLVKKFDNERIDLTIFDKTVQDDKLTDMSDQFTEIAKADALILSSTSVFNNTFLDLINATKDNCDIYTLGPSTILNKEMFQYRNIKFLFGSIFEPNDVNTLKIIQQGGGTKQFLPFMDKVFLNYE